jgi:O-antigen/teichoic acid export membrane protein
MQPPDLAYFVETYLLSVVITAIIVFIFMLFRLHLKWVKPDLSFLKTLIIRLTPYTLITFLMGVYGRLDSVLLHALLPDGDYQAGIYAAGFRMLDTYLMLAILFSNLLLPMLSAQQGNKDAIRDLLKFVVGIVMTATIIAGVGGWVFRQEITDVLYHQSDANWYDTVGLLFLTMIPVGLSTLYGAAIISTGRLHRQNILFLSGIVLSLTFNFFLYPLVAIPGSAISAFSVNLVIAVGQVIIFVKESDMGEDRGFYRRMILFFILSFVLFYIATLLAKSF